MPTYAKDTQVSSAQSRIEIERTLERYGANAFGYMVEKDSAIIMFRMYGRRIKITIPLPSIQDNEFQLTPTGRERSDASIRQEYEKAVRQKWRVLALLVKAKLEINNNGHNGNINEA